MGLKYMSSKYENDFQRYKLWKTKLEYHKTLL